MKKVRPVAMAMVMVMLLTLFASCSSVTKADNVVKEDDPWYGSTRFEITPNVNKSFWMGPSNICTSDDKIFFVYTYSGDMWASSKTVMDVYDFDGNLVNSQEVSCPEIQGFHIMNMYSLVADPAGKTLRSGVWYNANGQSGIVFIDIDTGNGTVSNTKDIVSEEIKKNVDPGSGIDRIVTIDDYEIVVMSSFVAVGQSYQMILYKSGEYVTSFDFSRVNITYMIDGFSMDFSKDSLYAAGYENGEIITMEFDLKNGDLKNKSKLGQSDGTAINFAEYTSTDRGEMCKIDSLGNIIRINNQSMTPETVIDTNWYTPFFYPINSEKYTVDSKILRCTDNRTIIRDTMSVNYGNSESYINTYIRVLNKADKNPNAGKKIIELAFSPNSGVSEYLAKAIYEFNITDNEYLIRVWDKYKSGYVIGRESLNIDENEHQTFKMIQDLKGPDAPDIAIGIQKNYAMRDEVFMDLTGFLDPEVLDKQYGNIIDAGKINGKLYFLPVTLEIEGLVTKEELLKDGAVGITFEEYDELINDSLRGFSPYDYPLSGFYNKRAFVLSCIDTKSAIDGEQIEFGTDQFRTAVEYAKDNFVYDDVDSIFGEYEQEVRRNRSECYYAKIADYLEYVHACYNSKDRYSIIGTPSVDASGPRFKALETISVSTTTDMKEGCRKFINYLFSGSAFSSEECAFRQIVTNREIMNKNIDNLSKINNEVYNRYKSSVDAGSFRPAFSMEMVYGDKFTNDDMKEIFLNSMSTISTYYYEDYTIIQFTLEELAPYYAGDRSLDEAIKILNDRVTKYIREM